MTGVVKFWNKAGWGIITPHGVKFGDREREVFVHETILPEGTSRLVDGQEVECSLVPGVSPPRALVVKVLSRRGYEVLPSNPKKVVERTLAYGTN